MEVVGIGSKSIECKSVRLKKNRIFENKKIKRNTLDSYLILSTGGGGVFATSFCCCCDCCCLPTPLRLVLRVGRAIICKSNSHYSNKQKKAQSLGVLIQQ
jgi:hypothetical protein